MKKKKIGVFDIETDPFKRDRIPQPFCCDFFDGESHHVRWGDDCIDRIWDKLKSFNGIIFAHNGGKFDFHYLLPHIDKRYLEIKVIGSSIAMMKLPNGTEFRDSYKMIPCPLSEHDKGKIDYEKFERENREKHRVEIVDYLKRDCESLYNLVEKFDEEYGIGLTIRGRAFSELKKMGWELPAINSSLDAQLRPFFYGGRVEAFKSGEIKGDIKCFDINSAYPRAMLEDHPWGEKYSIGTKPIKGTERQSFYELYANSKGAFPSRKENGSLNFPHCKGRFLITGWELETARKLNLCSGVRVETVYSPLATTNFRSYIERFYKEKLEAEIKKDDTGRLFAKLFMNSCYGGFAMNPEKFRDYKFSEFDEILEEPYTIQEIFPDGSVLWEKPSEHTQLYNVGTSASITGYVRAMLLESLVGCEDPLYCDTDSIILRGKHKLKIGNQLGNWKLEGEGKELYIGGKKIYAFKMGDKWKCASKGAHLTPKQIKAVAMGRTIEWASEVPTYSAKKEISFVKRKINNTLTKLEKSPKNLKPSNKTDLIKKKNKQKQGK